MSKMPILSMVLTYNSMGEKHTIPLYKGGKSKLVVEKLLTLQRSTSKKMKVTEKTKKVKMTGRWGRLLK